MMSFLFNLYWSSPKKNESKRRLCWQSLRTHLQMANRLFLSFRRAPGKGKGMFGGSILLQQVIKRENWNPRNQGWHLWAFNFFSFSCLFGPILRMAAVAVSPKKMTREKREDNYAHILRCHHLIQHMSVDS